MSLARLSNSMVALVPILLMVACAGMTPPEREPTRAWDQQAVTQLSSTLETSTEALYTALFQDPDAIEPGQENAEGSMTGTVNEMHEQAQALHASLEAGKDRAQTLDSYRRIKELSRDATQSSGYMEMVQSVATPEGGMTAILNQLDAYYGAQ